MNSKIKLVPIGVIRSQYRHATGTPIQPCRAGDSPGYVTLRPEYAGSLTDLGEFDRV